MSTEKYMKQIRAMDAWEVASHRRKADQSRAAVLNGTMSSLSRTIRGLIRRRPADPR